MSNILDNILNQVIILIIFSLIPAILLKLFEAYRNRVAKKTIISLKNETDKSINSGDFNICSTNKILDKYRNDSINLFLNNKLSRQNLFKINNEINELSNKTRITFILKLLENKSEFSNAESTFFAEDKITQREIYHLFSEIKNSDFLTQTEKEEFINSITNNCVNESKYIENEKLLSSIKRDKKADIKNYLKYASFALPVIILAIYLIYNYKSKPDATFGAVIYIDETTFSETFKEIKKYISKEAKKKVEFEYYSFDDFDELLEDMKSNSLQGVILNPGTYSVLFEKHKDILNEYEVFLRHQEDGKDNYQSVIITNKNNFSDYCREINKPVEYFETGLTDSVKYFLKHYFQRGVFGFVHRYSLSGYNLPQKYLWYDFNINVNEQDTNLNGLRNDFTGDHDKSINAVYNGELHCAVTYENRIYNIGLKDVKDKIRILYKSPPIPYNSYLYRKNLDSGFKASIINAFIKLDNDNSEKGTNVKKNRMRITGWKPSTDEQYVKMLEPCFEILNTKLPKPQVIINNSSTSSDYRDRLNDIIIVLTNKLKKINAWDVELQSKTIENVHLILINLNSYSDIYKEKPVKIISGYAETSEKDLKNFEINVDELKGDKDKIIKSIFANILDLIELKATIKYDFQGLFINLGKEDGVTNCKLILEDNNIIEPSEYEIQNRKIVFKKSDNLAIEKYRNKQVIVKYDLEEILKL